MDNSSKQQERENPSPTNSPTSNGSTTNGGGIPVGVGGLMMALQSQTPPLTPKPITRSDQTNPYPTTFVQADTSTFKQVVQMLTGSSPSSSTSPESSSKSKVDYSTKSSIPPIKNSPKRQQSFKLYERRNQQLKNNLMINTLVQGGGVHVNRNNGFSPRHQQEILSPSMLDFPKLVLSPVTPLYEDPFNNNNKKSSSSSPSLASEEEDKAIAEKGFYLHPSPRNPSTPRDSDPQLLPLFPLTSPRVSASSS